MDSIILEIFMIIIASIPFLFFGGIFIYFFIKWIKSIKSYFKENDISAVLSGFGVILLLVGLLGFYYWLFSPVYKRTFNRIPAYLEGKHLKPSDDDEVWFCTGRDSECYHYSKYCKGLDNCKDMVVSSDWYDAQENGYRPCTICYMLDEKYYK